MNEELVSFEVAQLLKARGFKCECANTYRIGDNIFKDELLESDGKLIYLLEDYEPLNFCHNEHWCYASAPTQSLAQKWLREVHGIHITIDHIDTTTEYYYDYTLVTKNDREYNDEDFVDQAKHHYNYGKEFQYNTYEEALEEGLKNALILIKNELNNN